MAFGIDDALSAVAAGVSLTDTIVRTITKYKKKGQSVDLERLLEEVRLTAIDGIDEADLALTRFERMLADKGVNIDARLADVIASTPFWKPFEQHRLSQIQKIFNAFADSIYGSCDDVSALVRCREDTAGMGKAIVEGAKAKHEFHRALLDAPSLRQAMGLLRRRLVSHKEALSV